MTNSQEVVPNHASIVADIISALGKAMSSYGIYGIDHPISFQKVEAAYNSLLSFFEEQQELDLGVLDDHFLVDGHAFKTTTPLQKVVEKKIIAMGIVSLRLQRGLKMDQFKKLIELLHQADEKKVKLALESDEFSNVDSKDDVEYQLIHKNGSSGTSDKGSLSSVSSKNGQTTSTDQAPTSINVEQIVAFMKGGDGTDSAVIKDEVAKLASDPEKLAQLILESVVMRQSVQSIENTESLSDVVLGCLRKTFDGIKGIDEFGKRCGRASMKKSLMLLEKSVMDRIHDAIGKTDSKQDKKIIKAIKNMKMDLDIEQAVNRYAEQKESLDRTKKKLAGYVERRGLEEVQQLGNANEIPESQWRRIEVDSVSQKKRKGSGTGTAGLESLAGDLGGLAGIFEKLDQLMQQGGTQQNVKQLVGNAKQKVEEQSIRTKEKINALKQKISKKDASQNTIDSQASEMTVSELLGAISEIVQELAQPLTAIDLTLEMVLNGFSQEIPEEPKSLLGLAMSSGDTMGHLLDQLRDIVGVPKNLGVDHRFHPVNEPK